MNQALRLLLICFSLGSVTACATNPLDPLPSGSGPLSSSSSEISSPDCGYEVVMTASSQNFARFCHPPKLHDLAKNSAQTWCAKHNKHAELQRQACGSRCTTSYFCK